MTVATRIAMTRDLAEETLRTYFEIRDIKSVFQRSGIEAFATLQREDRATYDFFLSELNTNERAVLHGRLRERVNGGAIALEPPTLRFLTVGELMSQPAPVWRVLRVIPERGLVVIWGASGSGKTFVAIDLACAIVRGVAWAERRIRRGPVAYIAAEGHLRERIDAYMQHNVVTDADLAGLRTLDASVNLLDPSAHLAPLIASLNDLALETGGIAVVIIDTLNRVMPGGDENSSEDMGRVVAAAKRIEAEFGCVVIFIHHSGKDEKKGSRGHSSLKAATDAELSVKRTGDVRTVTAEKVRDGADGEALLSFRLRVMDLGPMSDIDPEAAPDERRTSCIVEPTETQTTGSGGKLTDADQIALDVLKKLCDETAERTAATSTHPQGLRCADVGRWRERFRSARGIDTTDAKEMESSKKAFQRAADKLQQLRIVGIHDQKVWLWDKR